MTNEERLLVALEYQKAMRAALVNHNLLRQGRRMNLPARQAPGALSEFVTQGVSLNPQPDQGYGTMAAEMALGFVPGVGQAMAARDIERARRDNDPLSMALAGTSFVPFGKLIGALRGGKQMGPVSELDVYHGSPHRFPPTAKNPLGEFDASKIGTGEGAQAYGHGHYLAEARGVGSGYQKDLGGGWRTAFNDEWSGNLPQPAPLAGSMISKHNGNIEAAVADLRSSSEPAYRQAGDWLEKQHAAGAVQTKELGSLYKVDLPDEQIAKMLDWDKPLSQQPTALKPLLKDIENAGAFAAEKIKVLAQQPGLADWAKRDLMNDAAQIATSKSPQHVSGVLKRMQLDYGISPDSGPFKNVANDFLGFVKGMQAVPNMDTGGGAISYLQARYGQEAASKMLRDAGIPGIRYLDGGSRVGGKGTSNFVVFPGGESMLTILERNNQDVRNMMRPTVPESSLMYKDPFGEID
jgi:hypothetical protein